MPDYAVPLPAFCSGRRSAPPSVVVPSNFAPDACSTVQIPATPAYSISTPESIAISVPGSATTSRRSYYAAAQIVIQATSENIAITTDRPLDEELLRNDASTKKLTLRLILGQARFWNTGMLVPSHEGRAELLGDITSTAKISEEPLGWNAMIKPYLRPDTAIFLESDAEDGLEDGQRMSLSILLGQFVGYNISAP